MKLIFVTAAAMLMLLPPLCVSAETEYSDCYKALSELCLREKDATESIQFTLGSAKYTTDQGESGSSAASVFESNGRIYVSAESIDSEFCTDALHFTDTDDISLFSANGANDGIIVKDETVMIDIEAAAPSLGLDTEREGDTLTVTDPYASRRIIVTGSTGDITWDENDSVTMPNGTVVVSYDTREEAFSSCMELNAADGINAVPDVPVTLFEDTNSGYLLNDHLSWGAEMIKSDTFNSRLLEKFGAEEAMNEVTVGLIDSGVEYAHPFLSGRIDVDNGYDFYDGDSDPMDEHSHGTHTAGIICDNTLSNVTIIPYKITDANGDSSLSLLEAALDKAINDGVDVINMSLGSKDNSGKLRDALMPYFDRMNQLGITGVAAAGNTKTDAELYTPANITDCITVSACDSSGKFASSYSNYGDVVDVCAPGTSIRSSILNGQFGSKSGTSMACPHVSAAAAMLKSLDKSMMPAEVQNSITACAADSGNAGFDIYYGWGILDTSALADMYMQETSDCMFYITAVSDNMLHVQLSETYASEDGAVIAAAAYKEGIMTSLETIAITDTASPGIEYDAAIDLDGCDSLKVFLFEDLSSIKPLCCIREMNLTYLQ